MKQEMLGGLVVLFIFLVAGVYVLLAVRKLKQVEKDREKLLLKIRTRLVLYLNDELNQNGLIDNKLLYAHVKKLDELYDIIDFNLNVDDEGGFIIDLDWGKYKTKIEGYLLPPKWNLINNVPYIIK